LGNYIRTSSIPIEECSAVRHLRNSEHSNTLKVRKNRKGGLLLWMIS